MVGKHGLGGLTIRQTFQRSKIDMHMWGEILPTTWKKHDTENKMGTFYCKAVFSPISLSKKMSKMIRNCERRRY